MILALDIGTSSTRALLYATATGEPATETLVAVSHEPEITPDGGATLDADRLCAEAVTCAAQSLERAKSLKVSSGKVQGVAVSTFWHSFLGVDEHHRAITPVLLWADRRSAPQVARLRPRMTEDGYHERTGCPPHTSYLPGRLLYLQENAPEIFARCARFYSPGEYLFSRLFGAERVTCSVSMASGTGLLNQQARTLWDDTTLYYVPGLSAAQFSPIGDNPVSGLRTPYRERLPDLTDVPFFPALGDGACSNPGCGASTASRMALMIGTSGALRVLITGQAGELPPVPAGLWRYLADAERCLLGGALSNGGSVWAWLTDNIRLPNLDDDAMNAAIAAVPPDSHRLTVLPFFSGERAPLWRDDLRAAIAGLSATTTPVEIARAHLEAVAYRFAAIRERLLPLAPRGLEIIGTGAGLLAAPAWTQIIADVLGEPIRVSSEPEASARGAALLVRERLGLGAVEDAPVTITARYDPNPEYAPIYAAARARQERFLARLTAEDEP